MYEQTEGTVLDKWAAGSGVREACESGGTAPSARLVPLLAPAPVPVPLSLPVLREDVAPIPKS